MSDRTPEELWGLENRGVNQPYPKRGCGCARCDAERARLVEDWDNAPALPDLRSLEAQKRKGIPVATGCFDYFPDALMAVAEVSRVGNDQHNPGKPLHWDRSKSGDEADALARHLLERGTFDTDGVRHSAKVAWRALALLQKELEAWGEAIGKPEEPR